LLEQLTRPKLP